MIGSDKSRFEEERDGVQRREVDGETFWQSRHESSRVGRSLRSDLEVRLHLGEALRRSRRHHRTEGWKTEDGRRAGAAEDLESEVGDFWRTKKSEVFAVHDSISSLT